MEWVDGLVEEKAKILWMYGHVGAGKSTIAQSLAEQPHRLQKLLAAFFFFSRNDRSRSPHKTLVSTIAYQAALAIKDLRTLIDTAVKQNSKIFEQNLAAQMKEILVDPLNAIASQPQFHRVSVPFLIIIDGLDECSDSKMRCHMLEIFDDLLRSCCFPLKILLASRQEVDILNSFSSTSLFSRTHHLALSDKYVPEDDIQTFLEHLFYSIHTFHAHSFVLAWPGSYNTLVRKTRANSPTIIAFVASPYHQPAERLGVVHNLEPLVIVI